MAKFGGPNGYGHILDRRPHTRKPVSQLLFGRERKITMAETPKWVDLRPDGPGIMDQGATSTCYAHAPSAGLYGTAKGQGVKLAPWFPEAVPSQKGIADAVRMLARARSLPPGYKGELPPFEDKGAMPADVIEAIGTIGIRARRPLHFDDRLSDVDPATINDEAGELDDLKEQRQTVVTGEHFLDELASDYEAQLRATLAAKIWVCTGIWVDTRGRRSVEEWDPLTGPLGEPDYGAPDGGGHYVVLCGYDTLSDGTTEWLFQNSWGGPWGLSGFGKGNAAWLRGTSNTLPCTVPLAAAPVARAA